MRPRHVPYRLHAFIMGSMHKLLVAFVVVARYVSAEKVVREHSWSKSVGPDDVTKPSDGLHSIVRPHSESGSVNVHGVTKPTKPSDGLQKVARPRSWSGSVGARGVTKLSDGHEKIARQHSWVGHVDAQGVTKLSDGLEKIVRQHSWSGSVDAHDVIEPADGRHQIIRQHSWSAGVDANGIIEPSDDLADSKQLDMSPSLTRSAKETDNIGIDDEGVLEETVSDNMAEMFVRADYNEDGFVDQVEARKAGLPMEHFDNVDGSKDGRISMIEFQAVSHDSLVGTFLKDISQAEEMDAMVLRKGGRRRRDRRRRTCPNDMPILETGVKLTGKYDFAQRRRWRDVDDFLKECYCDCEAPSDWTMLEEARRRADNRRRRGQIGDGQYYIQYMSHWGQPHRRRSASDACRCAKVKKSSGKVHIHYTWEDGTIVKQSLGTCNLSPTDEFLDKDCYFESCTIHDVCLLKFDQATCAPYLNAREGGGNAAICRYR